MKILIVLTLLAIVPLNAQVFRTQALSDRIKTLQVSVADRWDSDAIIQLNNGEPVEIRFDLLGASPENFTYTITHCNADWTPSQLFPSEYMTGLQHNYLTDYANSFNTKMNYVHYELFLPNENIRLLVSGNYVVQVFSDQDTEHPVLNACFSIVERRTEIQMQINSVTDKGVNNRYQAVNFEVSYGNEIKSPMQELKVYVQQNNRYDNEAKLVKPLNLQNGKAFYDHQPALVFDAGNEYRRFEMTTTHYTGLNIEAIEYHSPYYHTILRPDVFRSQFAYTFNEDLNGRIYIRNNDTDYPETEADYQIVHFYLACDHPLPEKVYILSEAFNNLLNVPSEMEYSAQDKGYVKSALLKEGYYNYMYVTRKNASSPATTAVTEGDYYQTENEYCVMVYARTMGMRYDQLIGVQTLQFK
ncbi:hypothetical protein AGMMS50262_00490 [Bacteroidia bacterium]|nr:hypothetical protein AGMMS50262_00490 [Bacteroidia bacterium]